MWRLNYPQSVEGKKAQELLSKALPSLAGNEFTSDSTVNSFKLVFPFEKGVRQDAVAMRERISETIQELDYPQTVSLDVYDERQDFVVVHGFNSTESAKGFLE